MNHSDFVSLAKVRMTTEVIPYRTDCPPSDWSRDATHYGIILYRGGDRTAEAARFMLEYSQGSAHTSPPTVAAVIGCLQTDASSVNECDTFEEWADCFGYDTDSRSAERMYKTCRAQASKLLAFLGCELFDTLMECEEE